MSTENQKQGRGRPKKEQRGEMVWIPAQYVKPVKAFFDALKPTPTASA